MSNNPKHVCIIVGYQHSGKTHLLNQLIDQGYVGLNVDLWIHQYCYQVNQVGYQYVQEKFGAEYVNGQAVDRQKLKDYLLYHQEQLVELSRYLYQFLNQVIRDIDDDVFVELPTYFDYQACFDFDVDGFILLPTNPTKTPLFALPQLEQQYCKHQAQLNQSQGVYYWIDKHANIHYCDDVQSLINQLGIRKEGEDD